MKKYFLMLMLFLIPFLAACNSEEPVSYPQKTLSAPDSIEITSGSNIIVCEKDSDRYTRILNSITSNWWKIPDEESDSLIDAEVLAQLNTTTNRTTTDPSDIIISFLYVDSPMKWITSSNKSKDIRIISFFLPKGSSDDNAKGFFIISQSDSIGTNDGVFSYYYPSDITDNFWEYLNQ